MLYSQSHPQDVYSNILNYLEVETIDQKLCMETLKERNQPTPDHIFCTKIGIDGGPCAMDRGINLVFLLLLLSECTVIWFTRFDID